MGHRTSGLFPRAESIHVALYLLLKIQASHTFSAIDALFYVTTFFHKPLLNVNHYRHFFVVNI